MRQLITYILSIAILLSSTGLLKLDHRCMLVDAARSIDQTANITCATIDCCSNATNDNCCSTDFEIISNDNYSDYLASSSELPDLNPIVVVAMLSVWLSELDSISINNNYSFAYQPPPLLRAPKFFLRFAAILC